MTERPLWMTALAPLLYAGSVHLGVVTGRFGPVLLLFGGLLAWSLVQRILVERRRPGISALIGFLLLSLLWLWQEPLALFFLPPVMIPLGLGLLFGVTLLPGRQPLVTQVSGILGDELDDTGRRYTRVLTQAWSVFLLALAIEAWLLAEFASPLAWSLFTNGINYLLILAFFLIEFRIRRRLFPQVDHPGFSAFLRSLAGLDFRCLRFL